MPNLTRLEYNVPATAVEVIRWLRRSTSRMPGMYSFRQGSITLGHLADWPELHEDVQVFVIPATYQDNWPGREEIPSAILVFVAGRHDDEVTLSIQTKIAVLLPYLASIEKKLLRKWPHAQRMQRTPSNKESASSQSPDETRHSTIPTVAQKRAECRRKQAFTLRDQGLIRKEIAAELGVSLSTVDNYLKQ